MINRMIGRPFLLLNHSYFTNLKFNLVSKLRSKRPSCLSPGASISFKRKKDFCKVHRVEVNIMAFFLSPFEVNSLISRRNWTEIMFFFLVYLIYPRNIAYPTLFVLKRATGAFLFVSTNDQHCYPFFTRTLTFLATCARQKNPLCFCEFSFEGILASFALDFIIFYIYRRIISFWVFDLLGKYG